VRVRGPELGEGAVSSDVFSGFKRKILGGRNNKKMLGGEEVAEEIELGDIYKKRGLSAGGEETWENPMATAGEDNEINPETWERSVDEEGKGYLHNEGTGETKWE